jgi:hypothetical protein
LWSLRHTACARDAARAVDSCQGAVCDSQWRVLRAENHPVDDAICCQGAAKIAPHRAVRPSITEWKCATLLAEHMGRRAKIALDRRYIIPLFDDIATSHAFQINYLRAGKIAKSSFPTMNPRRRVRRRRLVSAVILFRHDGRLRRQKMSVGGGRSLTGRHLDAPRGEDMKIRSMLWLAVCVAGSYWPGDAAEAQITGTAPYCCGLTPVHDPSQKSMVGTAVNSSSSSIYFTGYEGDV